MSEQFAMSPEVRELLGELAMDETAHLLRVGSRAAVGDAQALSPKVSALGPFLKKAERRLLEAHREEVGRLLYRYSFVAAWERPGLRGMLHYGDGRPLPTEALGYRSEALLSFEDEEHVELLSMLRACLSRTGRPDPLSILAAAARLAPSTSIRIMQGNYLYRIANDPRMAERVLTAVTQEITHLASYAWEGLGMLAAEASDYETACAHYHQAVRTDKDRPMPKLAWLRFAYLAASYEDVLPAAEQVDTSMTTDDAAVSWYLSMAKNGNSITAGPDSIRLRRLIEERIGPIARAVTNDDL